MSCLQPVPTLLDRRPPDPPSPPLASHMAPRAPQGWLLMPWYGMVWLLMPPYLAQLWPLHCPPRCFGGAFKLAILTVVLSIHNPHQHALKMKCRVGILCLCSHCPPYLIQRGEGDDPMLYKLLQKGCASHSMSTVDQNHPSRPSKSVVSRLLGIFNEQPDMHYHSKASIYLDCFYGPI